MLSIRDGNDVVFGMYDDGNIAIKDDAEAIKSAIERCNEAIAFLTEWRSKKISDLPTESQTQSRVPGVYQPASVRCVTPCDGESIGIGFNPDEGKPMRIRLSKKGATQLADLIRNHCEAAASRDSRTGNLNTRSHS